MITVTEGVNGPTRDELKLSLEELAEQMGGTLIDLKAIADKIALEMGGVVEARYGDFKIDFDDGREPVRVTYQEKQLGLDGRAACDAAVRFDEEDA